MINAIDAMITTQEAIDNFHTDVDTLRTIDKSSPEIEKEIIEHAKGGFSKCRYIFSFPFNMNKIQQSVVLQMVSAMLINKGFKTEIENQHIDISWQTKSD